MTISVDITEPSGAALICPPNVAGVEPALSSGARISLYFRGDDHQAQAIADAINAAVSAQGRAA